MGARTTTVRTLLVLGVAAGGVAVLDARTPPRTTSAVPSDAGEVARLIEVCRRQPPTLANGSAEAQRPWRRLAELRDPAALPFLLERFAADPRGPRVLRDVVAAHGGPALAALAWRILDPNVQRGAVEAALEAVVAMDDEALFVLDAHPDLPEGFRAVLERWVRRRGAPLAAPTDWRRTLAGFVSEPVTLPDDGWASPYRIPFATSAWTGPRPDPFERDPGPHGATPRPPDLAPDALRRVRFRRADGRPWEGRSGQETLVVTVDPTDPPPWDDAAFSAFAWAAPSARFAFELDAEGLSLPHVPAVALHVFGLVEGVPFYAPVGSDARDVLVDAVVGGQRVAGRPIVDGRPVPDGTVLAPGRLDLTTVRAIAVRSARELGFSALVHARLSSAPVALPAADTLTAWHASFGIAWLPWQCDTVPSGASLPGRIDVEAGPGSPGRRLTVAAGLPSPGVRTYGASLPPHVVPWPEDGRGSIVGLPPGAYVVTVEGVARSARLTGDAPAAAVSMRR